MYHYKDRLSLPRKTVRPGIIHRLDKNTSGLLIIAKHNISHVLLTKQIQKKIINREYYALVWGKPDPLLGNIEKNIKKNPGCYIKRVVCKNSEGKYALTNYKSIYNFCNGNITLIKCTLITGRTHQIRVHMLYSGHSIVGDDIYSNNTLIMKKKVNSLILEQVLLLKRHALHANNLSFLHPILKKKIYFKLLLPLDITILIQELY